MQEQSEWLLILQDGKYNVLKWWLITIDYLHKYPVLTGWIT